MGNTTNETRRQGALRRRLLEPLAGLFKQGLAPEKIVLCVVAGSIISIFPILGTTTLLCTLAAMVWRLNLPAIQAVNWLFSGVQLLLIMPFIRTGECLVGAAPLPFSLTQLSTMVRADGWGFLKQFWATLLHAVAGWAVVCLPLALLAYWILVRVLRWRMKGAAAPSPVRE